MTTKTPPPPPLIGFGTAEFPFGTSSLETIRDVVVHAVRLGYRHFDTASIYRSEASLGKGISEALRLGLINSREELFVTSKLWCNDSHPHLVLPALKNTLKIVRIRNLKLEFLDLYLIHWPVSLKENGGEMPCESKENVVALDFKSVWEAMENCKNLGLAKSIGVSNFSCKKLQDLLAIAKVEMSPLWQQKKLRGFCKERGIHVTAYSLLGGRGTFWGSDRVMDCQFLKDIAIANGKTTAQVCIRWVYEQGVSVIVKSFNKERMEENLGIFDWELTTQELNQIDQIPQQRVFPALEFISDNGPCKTPEEFWDGEI